MEGPRVQARALTSRSEAVDKRNIEIDRKDAEVSARMAALEDRQAEVRESSCTYTHKASRKQQHTHTMYFACKHHHVVVSLG